MGVSWRQEIFQARLVLWHAPEESSAVCEVTDVICLLCVGAVNVRRVDIRADQVDLLPGEVFIARLVSSQNDTVDAVVSRKRQISRFVRSDSKALTNRLTRAVTRRPPGLRRESDIMRHELAEQHGHVGESRGLHREVFEQGEGDISSVG